MYKACIAVVDASRARLFTFERSSEVGGIKETLREQRDVIDPARRQRAGELFSEARPGLGRSGSLQYGTDDHRDAHIEAMDAQFARTVINELVQLLRASDAHQVIICASPGMLGELRDARVALPADIAIDEVAHDLVKLTPSQLREQLARYGLLPAKPSRPRA
jgi:protein required for attachment to host cells